MSILILGAVIIDLVVGDPRNIPHPVILIGKLISWCETVVHKITGKDLGLRILGLLLVLVVCGCTYLATWWLIWLAGRVHIYLAVAVHLWLLSTTLALKGLRQHAQAVADPLARGDVITARQKLALIVGRDTHHLDQREIIRGAVETVAENTVDGIISPLFYAFLGGAPLAMTYKAINTMDSMIGHKNERYRHLGWAAARLDDLVNYLPARLTAIFYLLLAVFTTGGLKNVARAIWYDAPKHPSPNSGIPEAAVAGALGVQLGGVNYYRGKISRRALMGEAKRPLTYHHIQQALDLTYAVTALAVASGVLVTYLVK